MSDVLVVGAGLSGLATAWYLAEAGARVDVVDAAPRPGGLIRTITTPHGLVETAANAFVRNARVDAMFAALDLKPCLLNSPDRGTVDAGPPQTRRDWAEQVHQRPHNRMVAAHMLKQKNLSVRLDNARHLA